MSVSPTTLNLSVASTSMNLPVAPTSMDLSVAPTSMNLSVAPTTQLPTTMTVNPTTMAYTNVLTMDGGNYKVKILKSNVNP